MTLDGARDDAVVFLLDVDNTLLDNDRFGAALSDHLDRTVGAAERSRYWTLFAARRAELGLADYFGALEQFRTGPHDPRALLRTADFLLDFPFAELVYPDALAALEYLATMGTTVALSDGDIVLQPRKIRRAGLWDAVAGRVLVYVHKEKMLGHVQQCYPGAHYMMVDDKPNLLSAMKVVLGANLTTIFVRQGHYAHDVQSHTQLPPPDRTIERIGDLLTFNLTDIQVRP